jgi:hypothetical protein
MKKVSCFLLSLFFLSNLTQAGEWVNLTAYQMPLSVQLLANEEDRSVIQCQINGYEKDVVLINGESYQFVSLQSESRLWEAGSPDLPHICRSLIIPDEGRTRVRVLSSQYREIHDVFIAPSKGHLPRSVDPADIPYEFGSAYQQDAWYPAEVVTLRDPYILRDVRGQVVEINAFQYNPVRRILRVYTDLQVEVSRAGAGGVNILHRAEPLQAMDPLFKRIYQRHFLNFDPDRYTPVEEVGPMLVITYDGFRNNVMPLVDWKNQKGIPTTIVNISAIGNNSTAIKNYIANAYNTSGLTFVLLVGDHAQVASPISGGGTDPTYALITGSDHYPELFVGRLSAENGSQVDVQVQKILNYEQSPQAGAEWYRRGTGIASSQGAGIGHFGESDFQHMNLIRADLLRYGYTLVDQIYDPGASADAVTAALNEGRGIVNYCGHGSTTSWGTTGFSNTNVNNLVNDNMLPFITSVACVNGNFTSSTCFAEAWLRASHNGQGTGAVGFYGSSQNQSWAPPMYAQDEFIDLLTTDAFHAYGALCFNGAMEMIDQTGSTGNSEFDHWHVFGDPSLQVRTAPPTVLTVTHNPSINYGQATFEVTVAGVQGALAALSTEGTFLGNGYTNASGLAVINVTGPLPVGGTATLTVTAYNAVPYTASIQVLGSTPDVNVTLTPAGLPIVLPIAGGTFDYNIAAANLEQTTQTFHIWCDVTLPNGNSYGPVLGPVSITLNAGASLDRNRTQTVPAAAPPGDYTYHAYAGVYPTAVWAQDSFTFTKSGLDNGKIELNDWMNSGESFENRLTAAPQEYALIGAFPNPFNPTTKISFSLPEQAKVSLQVYDLQGRTVAVLIDGLRDAGTHEVTFDASNLTSGVYFYRLQAGAFSASGKLALLK